MSGYRTAKETQIRCIETMRSWGFENVASSVLTVPRLTLNGLEWTPARVKEVWRRFCKEVLKPYSPEYFRVFEVQPKTGRLHVHFCHRVDGMASGSEYAFDGFKMDWIEKGPAFRRTIVMLHKASQYGFGRVMTEPLRNLEERDAEALARYLTDYLLKKNWCERMTRLQIPAFSISPELAQKSIFSRMRTAS